MELCVSLGLPNLYASSKKVFGRNKRPPLLKLYGCYLYLLGVSFESVARLLTDLGVRVVKSAVWYWYQQVGEHLREFATERRARRLVVVDETKVRVRGGYVWVFAAIDPENREIVAVHVSRYRECVDVLRFLKRCLERCEGKPVLMTDGGPWYRWPAQRLGLKHLVISGGERNRIERWFETLKDRLRAFDCYFPTAGTQSIERFCWAFVFFYNRCRWHQTLKGPPSGGDGGLKKWLEVVI